MRFELFIATRYLRAKLRRFAGVSLQPKSRATRGTSR